MGDASKKSFLFLICLAGDEWCTFFKLDKQNNLFQSLNITENYFAEKNTQ